MLIERALRDRVPAIQSGPGDVASFGATPQTFDSWGGSSAVGLAAGSAAASANPVYQLAPAQLGSSPFSLPLQDAGASGSATFESGIHVAQSSVSVRAEAQSYDARTSDSRPSEQVGTGTSFAIIDQNGTAATSGTLNVEVVRTDHETHLSASSETVLQNSAGADIAGTIGAVEATLAQARTDALAQIEQITAAAAERIAAIQGELAQTIVGAGDTAAALIGNAGDGTLQLAAPVLDLVAGVPGEIGADIDATITAGVDAALELGDANVAITDEITLAADAALDLELPLSGDDVAGGVTTLVGMVTEDTGFIVEDVTSGVAWPVAAATPFDTLAVLAEDSDSLSATIGPPTALLGIAEADGLLGSLAHHDDLDLGLLS